MYIEETDKKFVIDAADNSDKNVYIQGAKLNGGSYTKNYLRHADIVNGGTFKLTMGAKASPWGSGRHDVPSSVSNRRR